jgi:glyoxylase-like metal-dependent hydrolase (beta-lactamase superfamily II)
MRINKFKEMIMSRGASIVIALICLLSGSVSQAVDMTPVRVSEHGWYVAGTPGMASSANEGFMSNAGFVITDDGVVVFDALGTPALGAQLIAEIRALTDQPIRKVVVSHFHADHYYGLQAFQDAGIEIWAHRLGEDVLASEIAQERLAQRRADLYPFVDENTRLVPADRWIDGDTRFELGGVNFRLIHVGPAHSPEDVVMEVVEDKLLFAGDMLFRGRIPFVGSADTAAWLVALDGLIALEPEVLVPGHGPASTNPRSDLKMTRDYIEFVRNAMGEAVAELKSFDEAYADTDWSDWQKLPAFREANRLNAYNVFLQMEQSLLE